MDRSERVKIGKRIMHAISVLITSATFVIVGLFVLVIGNGSLIVVPIALIVAYFAAKVVYYMLEATIRDIH